MVNCCIDCRADSRVLGSGEWFIFIDCCAYSSVIGSDECYFFIVVHI